MRLRIHVAIIAAAAVALVASTAAAASPRQYVVELAKISFGAVEQRDANLAEREFGEQFDISRFAQRCMVDHWEALTEAQRADFLDVFSQALKARMSKMIGDRIRDHRLIYRVGKSRRGSDGLIEVPMKLIVDDVQMTLVYSLVKVESGYKLVDYAMDGILLSRNYRGQFNYLMRKYGFDSMLAKMKGKIDQYADAKSLIYKGEM